MPMAGAPRTRSVLIASQTASTSRQSISTNSTGSRVWSISRRWPSTPPIQWRVSRFLHSRIGFQPVVIRAEFPAISPTVHDLSVACRAASLRMTFSTSPRLKAASFSCKRRVGEGEDLDGQQAGVAGPAAAHADGGHRHVAGHLHHREQRIQPAGKLGGHGDADHRQRGVRGDDAGQVGRPAGRGDDHLQPPRGGHRGILADELRRAMGAHHADFVGHAELVQGRGRRLDLRPIAVAAHHDADQGMLDMGIPRECMRRSCGLRS